MIILKKYNNFIEESFSFEEKDHTYHWKLHEHVADLCKEKIEKTMDEIIRKKPIFFNDLDPYSEDIWQEEQDEIKELLPQIFIDILNGFYRNWNWNDSTLDEIKDNLKHWVNYFIFDDGNVSLDGDKIVGYNVQYKHWLEEQPKNVFKDEYEQYEKYLKAKKRGWDDNLSQIGGALFVLEKLGYDIPCAIVKTIREGYVELDRSDNFTQAMSKFETIRKDMKVDDWNCKKDMAVVPGKLCIYILPLIDIK